MRTVRILLPVVAVLAAVVVVGVAGAGSLTGGRRVAATDAAARLGSLKLPVGAVGMQREPAGDNGYLKPLKALLGDAARVVVNAWWGLPDSVDTVIAYVRTHPPAGSRLAGSATLADGRTGTSALSLSYEWPAVSGVLGWRGLTITATALSDGQTGVLAQAQSDWIVPRPPSERVSPRTRLIEITSGSSTAKPIITLSVTAPRKVRQIIGLINRLPITQPIEYGCPLMADPRPITMVFRTAATTPPVAILRYEDYRPWAGPSGGCKAVDLSIGGRRQRPLDGGSFLTSIARLLGKSLI